MLSFPSKAYLASLVCTATGTNPGALIILSAAIVEMSLTLTSALEGIIITLVDPRQPSKLISCLLRVDRFLFPLWVIHRAAGDGRSSLGGNRQRRDGVHPGGQPERRRQVSPERQPADAHLLLWWMSGLPQARDCALISGRARECPPSRQTEPGLLGDALGSPPLRKAEAFCQA